MTPPVATLLAALLAAGPTHSQARPTRENRESAALYSREHSQVALLISQAGKLVLEEYAPGESGDKGERIASCVKSLWGMTAMIAADEGLLRFDEKVADTLLEWRNDPRKAKVRVRDLLTMTSGLDPGYQPLYELEPENAFAVAQQLPMVEAPGARFTYGPANMEVFGALLERKLERRKLSPYRYLQQKLFEPLEVHPAGWSQDRVGHPMMSSGAALSAHDLLKLGRLLLGRGKLEGRRIFAAQRLDSLLQGSAANPSYAMTFWLNSGAARKGAAEVDFEKVLGENPDFAGWGSSCLSKAAPADLFLMLGSWNQRVYVVPSQELVVVRLGSGTDFADADFLARLFGASR